MSRYSVLKGYIEEKYQELCEASEDGILTPEGRGHLMGLEAVIKFIGRIDNTLFEKDDRDIEETIHPRYCWNRKNHAVLDCYGCFIEELDSEEEFLKRYTHRKVVRDNNITWLY